jgi:hypothetical protein
MKLVKRTIWMTLLLMIISGCSFSPTRYPDNQTPGEIYIPPSSTQSGTTGETQPGSPTPIPATQDVSGIKIGDLVDVSTGQYRFTMVNNPLKPKEKYDLEVKGSQASIASKDEALLISLISETQAYNITMDECILLVVNRMSQDVEGFSAQDADPVAVGTETGFISQISGTLFGQPFVGSLVAARPWQGRCFTAIGLTLGTDASDRWQNEGKPVFETIVSSLVFLYPVVSGQCEVSSDGAYGYSENAPIRTGNSNLSDGLARQEAYLNVLMSTEGKAISYTRTHSIVMDNGDILDVYQVSIPGQSSPVTLYLDMYTFEELKAPMNLSCSAPFPIGAP